MDVNETLARLRDAITQFRETTLDVNRLDAAHYIAEYADALDQWMTKGGFVPEAWLSTRLAMLQAEYRRGFEAAMLRNRAARTPLRVPDPLGPPDPANYDGRDPV